MNRPKHTWILANSGLYTSITSDNRVCMEIVRKLKLINFRKTSRHVCFRALTITICRIRNFTMLYFSFLARCRNCVEWIRVPSLTFPNNAKKKRTFTFYSCTLGKTGQNYEWKLAQHSNNKLQKLNSSMKDQISILIKLQLQCKYNPRNQYDQWFLKCNCTNSMKKKRKI